jgi:hypothetical protein
MSTCKCEVDTGDYSGCPRHGDKSAWAAEQARQEKLRAEVFRPLPHQWKIERRYVGGQHPLSIRKTCTVCTVSGHKSGLESVAPCPGEPHSADCLKSFRYMRIGDHFECECGVNAGHRLKPFWKVHVCRHCDRPYDKFLTKCLKSPNEWHDYHWRKR